MKKLITRHHAATWERGMIKPETRLIDFIDKIDEELSEFRNAYKLNAIDMDAEDIFSKEIIHEAVDVCAVIINMLKHYGYDFVEEFRKNVEHQESRVI